MMPTIPLRIRRLREVLRVIDDALLEAYTTGQKSPVAATAPSRVQVHNVQLCVAHCWTVVVLLPEVECGLPHLAPVTVGADWRRRVVGAHGHRVGADDTSSSHCLTSLVPLFPITTRVRCRRDHRGPSWKTSSHSRGRTMRSPNLHQPPPRASLLLRVGLMALGTGQWRAAPHRQAGGGRVSTGGAQVGGRRRGAVANRARVGVVPSIESRTRVGAAHAGAAPGWSARARATPDRHIR
jgi:hypothetical protein